MHKLAFLILFLSAITFNPLKHHHDKAPELFKGTFTDVTALNTPLTIRFGRSTRAPDTTLLNGTLRTSIS
jgi:hypothetical protein